MIFIKDPVDPTLEKSKARHNTESKITSMQLNSWQVIFLITKKLKTLLRLKIKETSHQAMLFCDFLNIPHTGS